MHVDKGLDDRRVDGAQEGERREELHHVRVDGDELRAPREYGSELVARGGGGGHAGLRRAAGWHGRAGGRTWPICTGWPLSFARCRIVLAARQRETRVVSWMSSCCDELSNERLAWTPML